MSSDRPTPDEQGAPLRAGGRAAGCLSVLLMVAALPFVAFGLLVYLSAEEAGAANSGSAGGLAGLGSMVGVTVMAIAACVFVVGAIVYIRSAEE